LKINFNITGTLDIPNDAIPHYDCDGKLYAYEFNGILYMPHFCVVSDDARGIDIITGLEEMENHNIKNIRYISAEFEN
jgi:hypothetical protein